MLFRPKEMDAASRAWPVLCPFPYRDIDVTPHFMRALVFYDPVAHNNAHGLTAVQTGGVDLNRFTREDPADRQGFEASLSKPFLLPVDRDAVLCRQVVEWREGSDQIGIGVEPIGHFHMHQIIQKLLPAFRRQPKLLGNLDKVRSTAAFHESFHNEMVRPIQLLFFITHV